MRCRSYAAYFIDAVAAAYAKIFDMLLPLFSPLRHAASPLYAALI